MGRWNRKGKAPACAVCSFQGIILRDKVSLQAQASPYFQLREKFKCIEHKDKSET